MPHTHSPAASAKRAIRAIKRKFIQPNVPIGTSPHELIGWLHGVGDSTEVQLPVPAGIYSRVIKIRDSLIVHVDHCRKLGCNVDKAQASAETAYERGLITRAEWDCAQALHTRAALAKHRNLHLPRHTSQPDQVVPPPSAPATPSEKACYSENVETLHSDALASTPVPPSSCPRCGSPSSSSCTPDANPSAGSGVPPCMITKDEEIAELRGTVCELQRELFEDAHPRIRFLEDMLAASRLFDDDGADPFCSEDSPGDYGDIEFGFDDFTPPPPAGDDDDSVRCVDSDLRSFSSEHGPEVEVFEPGHEHVAKSSSFSAFCFSTTRDVASDAAVGGAASYDPPDEVPDAGTIEMAVHAALDPDSDDDVEEAPLHPDDIALLKNYGFELE